MSSFPHYTQLDAMDCGPTCLRMIAKHYGRSYTLQTLRERSFITREGVSMLGISDAAESIGMHTQGVRITLEQLMEDAPLPCILHWNQNHFVVLYKISRKKVGFRVKRGMTDDTGGLRVKPAMTESKDRLLRRFAPRNDASQPSNSQFSILNSISPTPPDKNTR